MPVEMADACHVKTLSDWFGWWDGTFEEHTTQVKILMINRRSAFVKKFE